MIYHVALVAILAAMALALTRALLGPTIMDRLLALNVFGTKTVLIIAVGSFAMGRPEFLDLALIYALVNMLGTLAIVRFFRSSGLAGSETKSPGQEG